MEVVSPRYFNTLSNTPSPSFSIIDIGLQTINILRYCNVVDVRLARSLGRMSSRRVNFVAQRDSLLLGRRSSADEKYDEYDGEDRRKRIMLMMMR